MRKIVITVLAFVMFGIFLTAFAGAQAPAGNVFFGYSYFNSDISPLGRASMNGWEGTIEGKVAPLLGLVADFDGHYGSHNFNCAVSGPAISCNAVFTANISEYDVLFGPRLAVPIGKFRPFAEAMVGFGHVNANDAGSDTHIASAFGGGLDYRVIRPLAWRFQLDLVHTAFFSTSQNNVRFSTGIVFRF